MNPDVFSLRYNHLKEAVGDEVVNPPMTSAIKRKPANHEQRGKSPSPPPPPPPPQQVSHLRFLRSRLQLLWFDFIRLLKKSDFLPVLEFFFIYVFMIFI
jgi:hypothetical protein